ncbi:MAG: nucleoside 2-deoxyribosyltransferase [Bacillaceae bacterium]|nr:nucleoside 2-deoxyribosyltransferase [Bacillaceae bacterium]
MNIAVYGEIGIDLLLDYDTKIIDRFGGAGLYASISAAKQGINVEFMTVYGPEIDSYSIKIWNLMGVSFSSAKYMENYCLPKYLVKGYKAYEVKKSTPLIDVKIGIEYNPQLSDECEGILVFPVDHSLPEDLCKQACEKNIPVFLDPKPNSKSIHDARKILEYVSVLLVNEEEVLLLTQANTLENAIEKLIHMGPKYIIVKRGYKGCILVNEGKTIHIPAYKSNVKCTLGSGDVFGGALAATFLRTRDIEYSTRLASCVAANFIENFTIENIINRVAVEEDMDRREIVVSGNSDKSVYLAGPFFSKQEEDWVKLITNRIENCGFKVLSPLRENGIIKKDTPMDERKNIFDKDLDLIRQSDVVVALLDHNDPGTCFEVGFAYERGIPIIALKTSQFELNNMLVYGCNVIVESIEELIEKLYIL